MKANSLRRMPVVCNTRISTKILVPLSKISEDIDNKKNMARTSDPFPDTKDVQYQLRFFSFNFAKTACAMYIDIAREYLSRLKKQAKKSSAVEIDIPNMDVTVTVSVSDMNCSSRDEVLEKKFEKVQKKSVKLENIRDYLKGSQKYVTVTYFPNFLKLEKLETFWHSQQQAKIIIQVDLDCFA